jgi:hypothetical protein
MPTYVNTVIYKIICNDENIKDCYVGHTTNLKQRIIEHKYACCKETSKSYNFRLYVVIRENGGWDNWSVQKIEDYPCQTKQEATLREQYHYFIIGATLNTISPVFDAEKLKKWQEEKSNKAKELTKIKLQAKREERLKYLEEHKDEIKQHNLEVRRKRDKEKRQELTEKMKLYRQKNPEKIAEIAKRAYEKRKANGYYDK